MSSGLILWGLGILAALAGLLLSLFAPIADQAYFTLFIMAMLSAVFAKRHQDDKRGIIYLLLSAGVLGFLYGKAALLMHLEADVDITKAEAFYALLYYSFNVLFAQALTALGVISLLKRFRTAIEQPEFFAKLKSIQRGLLQLFILSTVVASVAIFMAVSGSPSALIVFYGIIFIGAFTSGVLAALTFSFPPNTFERPRHYVQGAAILLFTALFPCCALLWCFGRTNQSDE